MAAGLIALGVGWLAGSLLPATRSERQVADTLKDKAAPLVQELSDMAKESAQSLQEPAKEAAAEVKAAGVTLSRRLRKKTARASPTSLTPPERAPRT